MKFFKGFSDFLNEDTGSTSNQPVNGTNSEVLTNNDEMALQKELNEWSAEYSQSFKFKNAEPRTVTDNVTSTILPQYQSKVAEGINKMIEILSKPEYKGKIKEIKVVGHTSSTWGKATGTQVAVTKNQELSYRRSQSVINTIKKLGADKVNYIKFIADGKGLSERIVENDTEDNTPAKQGKAQQGSQPEMLDFKPETYMSAESKQAVNRRVVITLPKFKPSYKPKSEPLPEEKKKEKEIPATPTPTDITFNLDSYILTEQGEKLLDAFANNIIEYNKNNVEKIKDIYICSHSHNSQDPDAEDVEEQENKIFVISLNRAYAVKKKLIEKGVKDVNFHLLPASFLIPKGDSADVNKRVEIYFSQNEEVKKAKAAFVKLAKKYKIKPNANGEYDGNSIVTNKVLRDNILYNLEQSKKIRGRRKPKTIPLELWYDEYGKEEKDLAKFKEKVIAIVGEEAENFVYTKE